MASALQKLTQRASTGPKGPEVDIPLSKIRFDPKQPRKAFHHLDGKVSAKDQEEIESLASTIKEHGLIQAITLEEMGDGTYRVVVGERRTRAHMLLGLPTIRAVIRNDLTNPAKRLAYQLIENIKREDLSDAELAESIAAMMKGFDGAPAMKQVEIAQMLQKSEGWVTRYVKFGDDENQRLWVLPGIAETPENMYRLSILPPQFQVEIRRRVDLPTDHPDYLAKPVDRNVIDDYSRQAKIAKMVAGQRPVVTAPQAGTVTDSARAEDGAEERPGNGVAPEDSTGQTLAAMASEGHQGSETPGALANASSGQIGKYTLPASAREAILSKKPTAGEGAAGATGGNMSAGAPAVPPVTCRANLSNIRALFAHLEDAGKLETVDNVACTFNFSGATAQELANLLTGVVVDEREVPAVLQSELSRLQLQ